MPHVFRTLLHRLDAWRLSPGTAGEQLDALPYRPHEHRLVLCAIKNTRRKMEDRHLVVHDLNALFGLKVCCVSLHSPILPPAHPLYLQLASLNYLLTRQPLLMLPALWWCCCENTSPPCCIALKFIKYYVQIYKYSNLVLLYITYCILVLVKNFRKVSVELSSCIGRVQFAEPQSLYAIFDGHAGSEAATFGSAHLAHALVSERRFAGEPEVALKEAVLAIDAGFVQRAIREVPYSDSSDQIRSDQIRSLSPGTLKPAPQPIASCFGWPLGFSSRWCVEMTHQHLTRTHTVTGWRLLSSASCRRLRIGTRGLPHLIMSRVESCRFVSFLLFLFFSSLLSFSLCGAAAAAARTEQSRGPEPEVSRRNALIALVVHVLVYSSHFTSNIANLRVQYCCCMRRVPIFKTRLPFWCYHFC